MRSKKVRRPGRAASAAELLRSSSAQSIGVVVSEITSEIRIAIESVKANSRKKRPGMPPMNRMGVKTATSDRLIDRTVKPTSRAPRSAASFCDIPASMWREVFSTTTTASSTTNPVAIVKAMSDRMSSVKPARYMIPKEPMIETGTAMLGTSVARTSRRKK